MTRAMIRAWNTTRTVSANPPSLRLVPVCTLIGLWFPSATSARDLVASAPYAGNCTRDFAAAAGDSALPWNAMGLTPDRGEHDEFVIRHRARKARSARRPQCVASRAGKRDRRDDHDGLGDRPVVGDGEVDTHLAARRRDGLEPPFGAARERERGPPRRQVDHANIAPPHPGAEPGAQRLGAGFLGREAFGVGLGPVSPFFRLRPLGRGENAVDKTVAVALDHLGDAAHVGDIGADAENHGGARPLARPRSIAARILRTAAGRPSKIASPMRKWPMLSSTISLSAAICSAVTKSRPWPAWTSRPARVARAAPRTMRSNSAVAAAAWPAATASHQAPV